MSIPIHADVAERLEYNPETGEFIWKSKSLDVLEGRRFRKQWNTVHAGKSAGSVHRTHGYVFIDVCGAKHRAHRLAWLLSYGEWPEFIDHINGCRSDNRIENLRSVSRSENQKNLAISSNNRSGAVGVFFYERKDRWTAYIDRDGRRISLGSYVTKDEAISARRAAETMFGFHKNHGKRRSEVAIAAKKAKRSAKPTLIAAE